MKKSLKSIFTLNPVVGCTIGCPYCYARSMNQKYAQIPEWHRPAFFPQRLEALYKRRRPSAFFLSTMNDPSDWKPEWLEAVLQAVRDNPRHIYLFLSKRPNLLAFHGESPNMWLGCTVTKKEDLHRLDDLRAVPSHRRFISFEPLHGEVGAFNLEGFHWAWIGGETGFHPNKKECRKEWAESLTQQLGEIPYFLHSSLSHFSLPCPRPYPEDFFEEPTLF